MRILRTTALALLIVAAILALGACAATPGPLQGTQWRLVGWTLSSLRADEFAITATFADDRISGSSGVNSYGGPCVLGPGAAISVGALAGTQMAGPEPAMRAESAYLTLLGQAKTYETKDGKLILYDQGGNESLIFAAASK